MAKLSNKTVNKLEEKVDFNLAANAVNLLYGTKSCLNEETIGELKKLVKLLDDVTTYENIEDGDEIFELADSIESCIMDAEESLGKVSEFVSKVVECWPDPDEEFEDETN